MAGENGEEDHAVAVWTECDDVMIVTETAIAAGMSVKTIVIATEIAVKGREAVHVKKTRKNATGNERSMKDRRKVTRDDHRTETNGKTDNARHPEKSKKRWEMPLKKRTFDLQEKTDRSL
jgi:hypothetical protein